jgi:PKD repeat protein
MNTRKGFPLVALALLIVLLVPAVSMAAPDPAGVSTVEVVESTDEGLVLQVHIAGLGTGEIKESGTTYRYLTLPYSGLTSQVGKPALPTFGRYVALPQGAQVEVEILDASYEIIPDVVVYPAQAPQFDCGKTKEPSPFVIDQDFYAQDTVYPGQVAMVEDIKRMRGLPVTVVRFFPYQYNPATQELTEYSDLTVRLRFVGGGDTFIDERYRAESFEGLYRRLLLNYEQLGAPQPRQSPQSDTGAEFLIITHPTFEPAADDLAAWRNANGLDTEVRNTTETGATAAEIQAYILNAYQTWDPIPEFVLFVGDNEWIPTNYSDGTATDLYYFTVEGGDYYPDIHGGRISVDTLAQAQKTIDDIVNYDQNPVTDEAFYNNVTHAAYFQDDEDDGYESRRFVRTSEEMRDYLLSEGYTAERIYVTESYIDPTHYNDGWYGNGEPLPPELLRPAFAWDGDGNDISAAVEEGRFLLTHRDHGFYGGWGDPYYDVDDVLALTNGNLLPVVLSMNCQSGGFDNAEYDPCFAEAWLRNPNGGAVGVVSATRNSYSGYNDFMTLGIIDAIWPGFLPESIPGFDLPEYRMGVALNYGKYIMEITWGDPWGYQQLEWELFHYFGDPTMGIHIAPPFPDFTLSAEPNTFEVCVPEEVTGTIQVGQILTYTEDVTLEVLNVPGGVSADISPMIVTPPGTATLTLDVGVGTADDAYTLVVSGTAEMTNVHITEIQLLVNSGVPDAPVLLSPADGAVGVPRVDTVFEWSVASGANTYRLQVDDDPAFGSPEADVTGIATTTYTLDVPLELLATYYWRVSGANGCGEGDFSEAFSFTVEDLPCTLLVDDDGNDDYEGYYEGALVATGHDYDLWTVASAGSPTADDLVPYGQVIWLTGDDYGSTLTSDEQAALATYLDGGGRLFVSGQDIGYDIGSDPFYANYLHADYDSDDTNVYTLTGLDYLAGVDLVIQGGDGADNQDYPSDISPINGAVAVLDYPTPHLYGGVAYQDETYGVVYFSFGFEAIDNQADRNDVMSQTLAWLGGCECEPVSGASFEWTPPLPEVGEDVTFTGSAQGTGPISYQWDFGDGDTGAGQIVVHTYGADADYTVTMTATNSCGFESVTDTITVLPLLCEPVQIEQVNTVIEGCVVTFSADLLGDEPFAYDWGFGTFGGSTADEPVVDFGLSGTYPYSLTVSNCEGGYSDTVVSEVTVTCEPPCDEVESVALSVVTASPICPGDEVQFEADIAPDEATKPYTYALNGGPETVSSADPLTFTLSFAEPGTHVVEVAVWNCDMAAPVIATTSVEVESQDLFYIYLPLIVKGDGS